LEENLQAGINKEVISTPLLPVTVTLMAITTIAPATPTFGLRLRVVAMPGDVT
jgi:hypothetical protein